MLNAKHMPKGPKGQKRPADVIANAVQVMRIATGETEEQIQPKDAAATLGRLGGIARAKKTTKTQRRRIALKAARARWKRR